jgi:hypothetical protein
LAKTGNEALKRPGNFWHKLKTVAELCVSGRIPWIRRYIAYVSSAKAEMLTYRYRLDGSAVFTDIKSLYGIVAERFPRSLPIGPLIIQWENYLVKELQLEGVSGDDISKAAPYQLSLVSPFEPGEICFALRQDYQDHSGGLVFNYSHIKQVLDQLTRIADGRYYPTQVHAEVHVWEEMVLRHIRQVQDSADACCLSIRFSHTAARFGIVGPLPSPARSVDFRVRSNTDWLEQIYSSMLKYLADFSGGHPDSGIERIFVVGDQARSEQFARAYSDSLPAPIEVISATDNLQEIQAAGLLHMSPDRVPNICRAFLAIDDRRLPRLMPTQMLRRPFLRAFCRTHVTRVAVLAVLALAVWLALQMSSLHNLERRLADTRQKIAAAAPSVERLTAMRAELDLGVHSRATSVSVLDLLDEIRSSKPEDLRFSSIHYSRANRISLRGFAATAESPMHFVKELKKSSHFADVLLRHVSKSDAPDAPQVDFLIEVLLENG